MTRLNSLHENKLTQMVQRLEDDLKALKSSASQPFGGGAIKSYTSRTANTYDYNGILTQDPLNPGQNKGRSNFIVTVTADHANVVYGQLYTYMWVGSTANLYLPDSYFADTAVTAGSGFQINVIDLPPVPATASNSKRWTVQVMGDHTRNVWLKFYVMGLDSAQVSVSQTL